MNSQKFLAQVYDSIPTHQSIDDIDFYVKQAKGCTTVLELACGTGRITIPIARTGISIVGLDVSQEMLDVFSDKLQRESEPTCANIRIVKSPMESFALDSMFDLIIIPFNSFRLLLTVGDQLSCLSAIFQHLQPGGRLIIDVPNPDIKELVDMAADRAPASQQFIAPDGSRVSLMIQTSNIDFNTQQFQISLSFEYKLRDNGCANHSCQVKQRYIFKYELEHLLVRAGFRLISLLADYEGADFGTVYPGRLICTAQKPC